METFAELIERLGGAAKLSPEIDVPANTIRQWAARGSIPGRHWQAIVGAAAKLGIEGINAASLAAIASGQKAA